MGIRYWLAQLGLAPQLPLPSILGLLELAVDQPVRRFAAF
jgi:hypothetical protein